MRCNTLLSMIFSFFLFNQIQARQFQTINKDTVSIRSFCHQGLEKEIIRYQNIEKNGGWTKIQWKKKTLQLGDSNELVQHIRKRLAKTDETNTKDTSSIFDKNLEIDIKAFQSRNGLNPDGKIGIATLKELNVSVQERIIQLKLNMERCRNLPEVMGDKYILVNIPAFELIAIKNGTPVFKSKIVTGKESDKTATFKGTMQYVVFAPYWNIPKSIMQKEVLPEIAKHPGYMEQNHMEWFDGKIRQRPGPWNALGGVKFIFPNAYNMYMHDTPAKTLFNENSRAFSHGCIRIEEPLKMALFLLEEQIEWNLEKINSAMKMEKETVVFLKEKTTVYIVYFTAFIDEYGKLNFRRDIYGRDRDAIL
ncbi:MAG: murein L,D-transpeptidase [bacterium]|jgi:murein L,D-transpeptidase YcbB/YkuD|nr:L,D-transpeptidase family protein [Chitinophagaceae bacterium]